MYKDLKGGRWDRGHEESHQWDLNAESIIFRSRAVPLDQDMFLWLFIYLDWRQIFQWWWSIGEDGKSRDSTSLNGGKWWVCHILAHQHLLLSWPRPRDSPHPLPNFIFPLWFQFPVQSSHYPPKDWRLLKSRQPYILMPTNKLMLDHCTDQITTSVETFKRLDNTSRHLTEKE